MKVLVTGCSGFIGKHLIKRLLKDGFEVVGIDDYSNSEPDKEWESKFEFHQQDISKLSPGHSLFHNIECIFHLAAKARVQPSFLDPKKYHDTNVTGTFNLLEACKQWRINRFIFSSSSSVYGDSNPDSDGFDEYLNPPNPTSPYAFTKVQGEHMCMFYKKVYGMQCICLRYFNVYGDNQPSSGQYPQMLPNFLHLYKEGKPFVIYGDGNQRRDFTYVDDVVDANIRAMSAKNYPHIEFNIGTGINYSVNEICDIIDPKHPKQYLPSRNEPRVTLANNYMSFKCLEWKPTMTVDKWIKKINQKV